MDRTIKTSDAMEALGREIAREIKAGAVLALVGGLGAGKTHLTKGLAAELGHDGEVTSPTFALAHEYRGGKWPIFHLDFYRLESESALLGIGWDEMLDEEGIIIAEWADRFPELLPPETRWLEFEVLPDGARRVVERAG